MQGLNRQGVTVILTTHYLEEAEEQCDWIAIIDRGRVVACDRKEALLRRLDQKELTVTPATPLADLPPRLRDAGAILDDGGRVVFRYRPSGDRVERFLDALRAAGVTVADLATREADLEDVFL